VAPTLVAPGAGYVAAAPYGLNGNGYGYNNGYGYGGPPPPAYYNGNPVLSAFARLLPIPRPPAVIPYNGNGRCIAGRGYGIGRCYEPVAIEHSPATSREQKSPELCTVVDLIGSTRSGAQPSMSIQPTPKKTQ
jgi:hypothetical protein